MTTQDKSGNEGIKRLFPCRQKAYDSVPDPPEGEDDWLWQVRISSLLGDGLLHDITSDKLQEGKDVARSNPLRVDLFINSRAVEQSFYNLRCHNLLTISEV